MKVTAHHANALGCVCGAWRIWALSDGYAEMPATLLKEPDGRVHALPSSLERAGAMLRLSVNCFLLQGPNADGMLIDCGAGGSWDPTMGHLEAALRAAGVDAASIATVALTHTHSDHINGLLTPDGRELFPKLARIAIAKDAAPKFRAEKNLQRFQHLLVPIAGGDRLAEGVSAVAMPGHAIGHMGYRLSTGAGDILFCGDVIHVHAAQFARPELSWTYDDDQAIARATRIGLLRDAAQSGSWLAGAHVDFPGIGRIAAQGQGFAFEPLPPPAGGRR
ncbi:MAG: MBL fold metallo-hydrolase [Alphaproteobacteria bacterium]|nr:MBL fold metallo-hydrolase [Alphaproteobacteria bacterium]MCW5738565.1 MBL fold metallo-hydrolase [Alphaproteobacteria bacterium]